MLLKRILLFIYMLLPITIWAQGNLLKGTITDASGAPIPGAIVTIPDLKAGAVSDSDGRYLINHLPKGNYLLQVHMLSYNTLTVSVNISGITFKDFRLNESILERSEVVITGTSIATEQRKSTTPITSVRLKELRENASTNIIDAIAKLPGVNQVTTGPAISKPIIRGLGANRILVINDNVRQEGQQWGDEHGIEIDDYNISKVEVLKGPASLAYGSDALAGVVNIITDEPLHENKTTGNVNLNYQTNNGLAAVNANISSNKNGFYWKAYGTVKAAHDYRNRYDGYVYNSRFNNADYGVSIGLNKQWGNSKISFSSFNQNPGIAGGNRDSITGTFIKTVNNNDQEEEMIITDKDGKSYKNQIPYQHIAHQKIAWNNNFYLKNGRRIGITLAYQQNSRKEFESVLHPNEAGLHFMLKTYSYDAKYFFPQINNWQITAGINGMYQNNRNKGIEFLIPDYNLLDAGIYTIARKEIGKWSLSGGLRFDHRNIKTDALYLDSVGTRINAQEAGGDTKFNPFTRSFANLTGSVGASYSLSERTTLKINIASGYRAPNIAELSANGVHEGTIRYEYGNNNLKAENSYQTDLGVSYNADHIFIEASIFANYIRNFIYLRKLQSVAGNDSIPEKNNEESYSAFIYDQRNAILFGGELYFDLHPHPLDWLHFDNTFSYVRGKQTGHVTDSTENLPYIPPFRWLTELRVQKKSFSNWLKNGFVKLGVDVNFDQPYVFSAYETEKTTSAYTLLNAGMGFDIVGRKQKTICSIILAGQNLLNTPYQNHLSRLRYAPVNIATGRQGIWNTGRNISIAVNVPLTF